MAKPDAIVPPKRCPTCLRPIDYPKTIAQRNKFHAICRQIGNQLGNTPAEIKTAIKTYHYGMDEFKVGDKWYRGLRSTEDDGKIEYSELIEVAYRWAAENGIAINE